MFQANTNASLKNLETQVGQLALSMKNQSRDSFPSDTKKNPKDCMKVTLRSGKELQKIRREDNEMVEKEDKIKDGKESEQNSSEMIEERRKSMVQQEQLVEEGKLQKKEEVRVYVPHVPFPQRL